MARRGGHYMLHEMYRAVITYEPERVLEILKRRYQSWRILRHDLRFVRAEQVLESDRLRRRAYLDALWVFRTEKHGDRLFILVGHEVKTGRTVDGAAVSQVAAEYRMLRGLSWRRGAIHYRCLLLWVPSHLAGSYERLLKKAGVQFASGFMRVIPLELLDPLVRGRLLEVLNRKKWIAVKAGGERHG